MRWIVLIVMALASAGFCKNVDCIKDASDHRCPVYPVSMKGADFYCVVYSRGIAKLIGKSSKQDAGDHLQTFSADFCKAENHPEALDSIFEFRLEQGGNILSVADSNGSGFALDLTDADKAFLKQRGKRKLSKTVKLKKKIKDVREESEK